MRSFCLFFSLLTTTAFASSIRSTEHRLEKRDPSGVLATNTYQNCVVRDLNYHVKYKGHQKCDDGIQMGECHENSRVMNQVFAVFEPKIGANNDYEGAWYGRCCAYDIYPEDSDMGEVANPNYVCMTWETSDKKQGNGPPTMPKTKIMPFPIICPSTLANCYSKNYYSPGSTMAGEANNLPTFTGLWGSPKSPKKADGSGGVHLWCDHICGGCEIGTWYEFKSDRIANLGCDISKCKPYTGNTEAKVNVKTVGTYPAVDVQQTCKAYGTSPAYTAAAGGHGRSAKEVAPRTPIPVGTGGKGQGVPKVVPKLPVVGGNNGTPSKSTPVEHKGGQQSKSTGGGHHPDQGGHPDRGHHKTGGHHKVQAQISPITPITYEDKRDCKDGVKSDQNVVRRHLQHSKHTSNNLF